MSESDTVTHFSASTSQASTTSPRQRASRSKNSRNSIGYKRRKDGCLMCRKRRVKCSLERPRCKHCSRLTLDCTWPADTLDDRRPTVPIPDHPVAPPSQPNRTLSFDWSVPTDQTEVAVSQWQDLSALPVWPPDQTAQTNPIDTSTIDVDFLSGFFGPDVLDFSFDTFIAASNDNSGNGVSVADVANNVVTQPIAYPAPDLPPTIRIPVTTSLDDIPFITHYLESISQTAKVRDSSVPNHYLGLFAAGLAYPPLYTGILAWSAWHLAHIHKEGQNYRREDLISYSRQKRLEHEHILSKSVADAVGRPHSGADLEVLLSTLVIYCNYEIVSGAEPSVIHGLLSMAKSLTNPTDSNSAARQLTSLAQRTAAILTSYDIRASMFGLGTAEYTLQLTSPLFDTVQDSPSSAPSPALADWSKGSATLLHLNHLHAQCIRLERKLCSGRDNGNTRAVLAALRTGGQLFGDILELQALFDPPSLDHLSSTPWDVFDRAVNPPSIDDLVSLAFMASSYNSLVIYLARVLNVPPPLRSINRILTSAHNMSLSFGDISQTVFPRQLFFAALETKKPDEYDWALARLGELAQAGWGKTVDMTTKLLVMVRDLEAGGSRQDIGKTMMSAGLCHVL